MTTGVYLRLQKYFTDRSIAEAYQGEITQAVYHVLKLEFKFNYQFDRAKHIEDIANWLSKVASDIDDDKKSKGAVLVIKIYRTKLINPVSLCNSFTNRLRKKYNFTGRLTVDDLDNAIDIVLETLTNKRHDLMVSYLNKIYPDDGLRLRRFVQILKR